MDSRVSICIPVYNQRPDFLRLCLESALRQTCENLEIVVAENHSTNEVPEVLREFSHSKLRVVTPSIHLSMSQNFRFCAEQAEGDYLCFLPSDDTFDPDFCGRLTRILDRNASLIFVHCYAREIDEQGAIVAEPLGTEPPTLEIFDGKRQLREYAMGPCHNFVTTMMRKSAYQAAGGFGIDLDSLGDWDFYLRLLPLGEFGRWKEVLVSYRNWTSPARKLRLGPQIRDVRLLYQRHTRAGTFNGLDQRLLDAARKNWAAAFATQLPKAGFSAKEYEQTEVEILALHQGWQIRAILWLSRVGMVNVLLLLRQLRMKLGAVRRRLQTALSRHGQA